MNWLQQYWITDIKDVTGTQLYVVSATEQSYLSGTRINRYSHGIAHMSRDT